MNRTFYSSDYLPILVQLIVAFGFVAVTMTLTHFIGAARKKIHVLRKEENFECGIEVKGNARFPFSVHYFLIAILFVLFDVEIIFFYPWAIDFKEFGWDGFLGMLMFLAFVVFGFYYVIKKKALDWD